MADLLIIDDDIELADGAAETLRSRGAGAHVVHSLAAAQEILRGGQVEIDRVLCDWDLGLAEKLNGGEIVEALHGEFPEIEYAVWSGVRRREVPSYARFFLKDTVLEVLEWATT